MLVGGNVVGRLRRAVSHQPNAKGSDAQSHCQICWYSMATSKEAKLPIKK